jgi:hypothetical protein
MPRRVTSKRQAGYLGLVASGKRKLKGLSAKKAREMLRGTKVKKLPTRRRKRKR